MKNVLFAVVLGLSLVSCTKKPEATPTPAPVVAPAPIESPQNQTKVIVSKKKTTTPRLDALIERVDRIERKIKMYEQKFGQ